MLDDGVPEPVLFWAFILACTLGWAVLLWYALGGNGP